MNGNDRDERATVRRARRKGAAVCYTAGARRGKDRLAVGTGSSRGDGAEGGLP